MHKKRVLVVISFSFSIRYIVRTGLLTMMRDFCEPVIAMTWGEPALMEELRAAGYEVHCSPEEHTEPVYVGVRRKIDTWFEHYCLKSPSRKIQENYLNQFRPFKVVFIMWLSRLYTIVKLSVPFYKHYLFKTESRLLETSTNFATVSRFVEGLSVDAVFTVTPFHRQEDLLLRACKMMGKQMFCSILSFDNITKRGWIPVEYDAYMVWNEANKQQLYRAYPKTQQKPVVVTGAAQFDFYFNEDQLMPVEAWRKVSGIPAAGKRKIILYSGGPQALFPQEPQYLQAIDAAITSGLIKGGPIVIFRCHPIDDIERWKRTVGDSGNIIFDSSWTGKIKQGNTNISVNDIKKLCSTLAYTDVHVNLCSTMTVDGASFYKPQIGPAYMPDGRRHDLLAAMYKQEHFEPVLDSNVLKLAYSSDELVFHINAALESDDRTDQDVASYQALLSNVITYYDGCSTQRVAEIINNYLNNPESLDIY